MKLVKNGSLFMIVLFALIACISEDAGQSEYIPLTVRATAEKFGSDISSRTVEVGSSTQFETDDRMGLFAVKNGAIVDGINNIELRYSKEDNSWTEVGNSQLYYSADVTYYAYIPYKVGVTFDLTKSLDANVAGWMAAGGPFALSTDQSTPEKYVAVDLMAAEAMAESTTTTLTLAFKHRMSLLILKPMRTPFVAPTGVNYSYKVGDEISDEQVSGVTINGIIARKMDDGNYRVVVPPGSGASQILKGEYAIPDGEGDVLRQLTVSASLTDGFAMNKSYLLKTNHTYNTISTERPVQVGDYFYRNNEILPNDALTPPSADCVGIVGALYSENWNGMVLQNESYTTGVVVALRDADKSNYANAKGATLSNFKNNNPVPTSSSGWYLSLKEELQFICSGALDESGNVIAGVGRRDFLEKRLVKVGGSAWNHSTDSGTSGANRPFYAAFSTSGTYYIRYGNGALTGGWDATDVTSVRYSFAF